MVVHVTICVCTYCRVGMLERLLRELSSQATAGLFTFSVVITDNDAAQSARAFVERFAGEVSTKIIYTVQPEKNIALARNLAVAHAAGDFIAFIDDDEFPAPDWLLNLFRACESKPIAGVLGPVKPHFEAKPPAWLIKGGFFQRPSHPTGFIMPWHECRTGNLLFRRSILDSPHHPFRPDC